MALGRTVRELGDMPQAEIEEWKAFSMLEPFGDRMQQIAIAHAATAIVASNGVKTQPFSIMPWLDEDAMLKAKADIDPDAHSELIDRLFGF